MAPGQSTARPRILDRLDLSLATKLARDFAGLDSDTLIAHLPRTQILDRSVRDRWISGVLGIRGIKIPPESVRDVLEDRDQQVCLRQERVFVRGLDRALDLLLQRGRESKLPDGDFMVTLFEAVTRGLPRFTNNHIRRDAPWDSLTGVSHPAPADVPELLLSFTADNHYRDLPQIWRRNHPVRRGTRAMWRFARIAPFPDFNRPFAFIFLNSFLLASGYPLLMPDAADKVLLENVSRGGVPHRVIQFESRLLRRGS